MCFSPQALCAMHKLPQRMLDQLLKPQAQHSVVADTVALQRSGLPALLRDALQAAFNKSQAWPCPAAGASTLLLLACTVHTTYANSRSMSLHRSRPLQSPSWDVSRLRWCRFDLQLRLHCALQRKACPALVGAPAACAAKGLQAVRAFAGTPRHREDLQHHWHHFCTRRQSSAQ
jgi:hypothetical protein